MEALLYKIRCFFIHCIKGGTIHVADFFDSGVFFAPSNLLFKAEVVTIVWYSRKYTRHSRLAVRFFPFSLDTTNGVVNFFWSLIRVCARVISDISFEWIKGSNPQNFSTSLNVKISGTQNTQDYNARREIAEQGEQICIIWRDGGLCVTPIWWQTVLGMTPWEFPGCAAPSQWSLDVVAHYYCYWWAQPELYLGRRPRCYRHRNCLGFIKDVSKTYLGLT